MAVSSPETPPTSFECRRCGQAKAAAAMVHSPRSPSGVAGVCRSCLAARRRGVVTVGAPRPRPPTHTLGCHGPPSRPAAVALREELARHRSAGRAFEDVFGASVETILASIEVADDRADWRLVFYGQTATWRAAWDRAPAEHEVALSSDLIA